MSLFAWDFFVLTPEIQNARQAVLSFCQGKGFTGVQYIEFAYYRSQGFCYKEVNGYLEKQSFFVSKQGTVLMVDE